MKKIEIARQFLSDNISLFRCPTCGKSYKKVNDFSIICPNNHSMDISKKGTLYFINHKVSTEYDKEMLNSRRKLINAGLFDGIINKISDLIPNGKQTILDVGSGEGTPIKKIEESRSNQDHAIGFDISKPGVNLATSELSNNLFYCVADLAQLPFNDKSISVVTDMFSPSSYEEFNRIINKDGHLIKVIPNTNYLIELRRKLYKDDHKKQDYDNTKVLDLFMKHYPNAVRYNVKYRFSLPESIRQDMILMTPMHWGKNAIDLQTEELKNLNSVTVDVTILDNKF
ncbi:methyltransferase domain-containing protein [Apilactobacillus quenuiae]|uniref:methyltransferase domain-containing protein n=1 Tax=Apilactobacillus quenuiae TaxID=2008377 RepID=UPI000D013133|nr:methyltransferase domain-containing protein [Apilactobacillus quenuiae]